MAVEGGTRVVKYLLFIFNLLFLLAGLALIIIGAVATAKLSPYARIGDISFNGAGVFIIIIGIIIFVVSFFGCLGAYKENYCLIVTFIVLMTIILLALIAALITAFVMRNQVQSWLSGGLNDQIAFYDKDKVITEAWDAMQKDLKCCGSYGPESWLQNPYLKNNTATPDSCCVTYSDKCGYTEAHNSTESSPKVYQKGCGPELNGKIWTNLVAVGGAAAAIAILMLIGILFASCLAHGIRKSYQVV